MRLYSFGGLTFPTANGEHSMPREARSSLLPLANGSFDQDGGSSYFGASTLTYRALIVSDLDATVDALLAMVGQGRKIMRAVMRDGTTYRQTFAKLTRVQLDARAGEWAYQQPITLTFERDYPYWLASADEPVYLNDGYLLDGSWEVGDGNIEDEDITGTPHDFTITNSGGARVPRGYMLFEPQSGATIEDITITNDANDMELTYGGSLEYGDSLEIDLLTKTVEKNASGDYGNLSIPANQRDWMILEVGDNDISIASTVTGTVDFYWQWSRHYR